MPFTSTGLPVIQGFNLLLHHFQLIIEQFLAYHTTIWRTQASRLLDQGCFICSTVSQACSHLRNATKKTADLTNTTRQRPGPLWEQHDLDWTEINGFHEKTHAVKKELTKLGEILQLNQNISFSIRLHCSCWYVVVFIPRHMWDWPGIEDLVAIKVLWFMARSPPSPPLPPGYGHTALGLDAPPPLKLFARSDELEQYIWYTIYNIYVKYQISLFIIRAQGRTF